MTAHPASLVHALHAPRRREILRLCWDEEQPASAIHAALPDVTAGAISQHLRVLLDADLVQVRRAGRHRFYKTKRGALGPLRQSLLAMWADALYRLQLEAELEQARRGPMPARARRRL